MTTREGSELSAKVAGSSDTGVALPHQIAVRVRDLEVSFGGVHALQAVSFEVEEFGVVAIVGPNGAGKTTILNAVGGLTGGTSRGSIQVYGEEVRGKSTRSIARLGVGRSFQDPPLIDDQTILENVAVGAHMQLRYGMWGQLLSTPRMRRAEAEAQDRAFDSLKMTGLAGMAHELVGGQSYGVRKLTDFARALTTSPRILFLDEPTSGLDSSERRIVQDLILELRASRAMTIVLVEHHMDVVREVATSALGLQAGRLLTSGTAQEVLDSAQFRAAIVGDNPDDDLQTGSISATDHELEA